MALGSDYDALCPLFDWDGSGGVLFPLVPGSLSQLQAVDYCKLDSDATDYHKFKLMFKARLVTCYAVACTDASGTKAATTSTEPVIGIAYTASTATSNGAGTEIATISCTGTGDAGTIWPGTTTATTISANNLIWVYAKTPLSTSDNGAGRVVLWFAVANAP